MKTIHLNVHGASKIIIGKEVELGTCIIRNITIIHPDDDGMDTTIAVFNMNGESDIKVEIEE